MRASLTCREAYQLYWELQGRVRSLRAKNVERRRKRQALFAQLQASRGLEVLALTNVQHPSSSELCCDWLYLMAAVSCVCVLVRVFVCVD